MRIGDSGGEFFRYPVECGRINVCRVVVVYQAVQVVQAAAGSDSVETKILDANCWGQNLIFSTHRTVIKRT